MAIKSIADINIRGKRVLFRFDFNVPLDQSRNIKDDTRNPPCSAYDPLRDRTRGEVDPDLTPGTAER